LIRPELPFAAGVCVVVGEILAAGRLPAFRQIIAGFMCGFFISGSAIILNDYFDIEVDRVNTPERPLPAGLVSRSEALWLAGLTICLGLAAAWTISFPAFVLCIVLALIGFLYNWKFKEAGLIGNLMVSTSVAITFILGGMAVGDPWNRIAWTFGLMAFFIDLGEELAGDAMDMEGDKMRRSRSIAILHGRDYALRCSALSFGAVVLLSSIPVIFHWLKLSYLIMIGLTDILIIAFTTLLLKSRTPTEGRRSMRWIYLGALVGVLAFVVGTFIE
jgi:geranylgeranylglycerol-phosphate geranylgeranyltransferase